MTSAFFGLSIGSSALAAAQTQVDIANQNIANANTPGYSRQTAVISATAPYPVPTFSSSGVPGQLGTGVQVNSVNRARDTFVDSQIRGQMTLQGQADATSAALSQVEATVNEPSSTGLSSTLTAYWSAWHEVANTPSDSSVRANLVEAGTAVADAFKSAVTQFKQQQQDLDAQVAGGVTNVNTDAKQIATLNTQIAQVESTGMQANDLRDQRDLVVDHLSSLVKITTSEGADGQLSINVGSHQLVDRGTVHSMVANTTAGAFTQIQWSSGAPAVTTGASAPPAVGTSGSIVINGVSVATTAGDTATQVMAHINGSTGLGPNGAVTASLSTTGALVLTSNTKGSPGTVVLGVGTGSAFSDLGLAAGTSTGTDDNVNLGGGRLQGLITSRDQVMQGQIDRINALSSRVIQSVNSISASGVGLDGVGGRKFFSGTNATDMAVDSQITAAGGTDKIAAARMVADPTSSTGYSSATGDNSNALALAELANATAQPRAAGAGLTPGQSLAPTTLLGVDLSGASANTTYTFSVTAGSPPTVSASDGTTATPATLTLGVDSAVPPNSIINVDTGSTRLTLLAATGTTLSAALAGLNGKTVTTVAGPSTIGGEYAQQVAALGTESKTAQSQSANQAVLVSNLTTQRQQLSGVSLDEETVNLMKYQKAYQAAARVITVMDGMLDTIINHMGTGT